MIKKQKTKIEFKRQLMRIAALVCVVCFVVVFLISSAHFANHAQGHAGSAGVSANACQRTLMPECECEVGFSLTQLQIQTYISHNIHSHSHSETHSDCLVCVFIQKTVNQARQFSAAVTAVSIIDTSILALFALCVILGLVGLSTPVKLKIRTNN